MCNRNSKRWMTATGGAILAAVLLSSWALGAGTKFWTSATYEDFARGNFTGVSLSREGALALAPQLQEVFSTDQAMVWSVARDQHGNTYLGTGHSGKVFRLGSDLKGSVFFDAPEPDVFAVAVDKNNQVFVGTSPDGKIYKLDSSGKGKEFFDPKAKYIWAMTFGSDGTLYVGTGDRGKIYRVRANGEGELFYDTHQSHVMSLATTSNNELLAGSEPNGLLYRISASGKAFVVYDSPLAEIHRVAVAPDGNIYVAALGGSEDRRFRQAQPAAPSPAPVQGGVTTITVRAAQEPELPSPGQGGPGPGNQGRSGSGAVENAAGDASSGFTPGSRSGEGRGIKSALYRVSPDGAVETLWNSPRENVFDLMPSENRLLFSTDDKGRIYELAADRRVSLLTQTDQEETTRLIPYDNFFIATTANLGKVYRVGTQPAAIGSYESDVHDAGAVATWGKIRWTGEQPAGTSVELLTRSGNSRRPDATWSDWSAAAGQQSGEQVSSPAARYIQWKAALHSAAGKSPVVQEVTLAYLPRNQAPTVTELKVVSRAERAAGAASTLSSYSAPQTSSRGYSGFASSTHPAPQRGFDISWVANDPDQDELTFNLYFRGEGETEWKLLQGELKQNYYQLENDVLPDGKYRLKVVASDASANAPGTAKTAERTSASFLINSTPPQVEMVEVKRTGGSATARFKASDKIGVLTRAEYVLDADPPQPLLSDDGILDSREETFTVVLNSLDAKEHLITLRVYDSSGNVGVGKAVWPASSTSAR